MIKFGHIEYLLLLFLIPIILMLIFWYKKCKRKNRLKFYSRNLEKSIIKNKSLIRERLKYTFQVLGILFLIIGLSLKVGTKLEEVKREGIEMVIALDLSNSMLCEDIKPNRLSRSKQAISDLIDQLEGDKIGLVIFFGRKSILNFQLPQIILRKDVFVNCEY